MEESLSVLRSREPLYTSLSGFSGSDCLLILGNSGTDEELTNHRSDNPNEAPHITVLAFSLVPSHRKTPW